MTAPLVTSHPSYASSLASNLHTRLGWGTSPALLLIDVCSAYWSPTSPLSLLADPAGSTSPACMRRLLAAARTGATPVLWAQVRYNHPKMLDGAIQAVKAPGISIWQDGDTRGMDAWLEGLTPGPDDVVVLKKNPSAFFGTNLAGVLQGMGVDTVVVCGVSTSGCVRATAVDAVGWGFRSVVVDEGSGDRSREIQQATLFDLESLFADVVAEEEAVEKLGKGWER
ncbi:Isochorismatase hydrolase [Mytilinidion resinicola]|uniref:Isochorismatase hydrolase n=1 Tax=Mytilinidion resinicola TaxID=574789 RepID=A0A6A6YT49_9PEZI|nr:Isochorismatase hydrolase [Mytilinidion resinicola]KAF2811738.1 Isochorismatase hydrolase [Mytilinidion resinicola]